jgi:hypothetical protein
MNLAVSAEKEAGCEEGDGREGPVAADAPAPRAPALAGSLVVGCARKLDDEEWGRGGGGGGGADRAAAGPTGRAGPRAGASRKRDAPPSERRRLLMRAAAIGDV